MDNNTPQRAKMKRYLLLLAVFSTACCYGQQYSREITCGTDTVTGYSFYEPYPAFACTQVSGWGLRAEIGVSGYAYNNKTKQWLGNHFGGSLGLAVVYKNFTIGFRFKPWTIRPKTDLAFGSDTLTRSAELNPIKLDYYVGYSIDLKHNISVEPYIGWTSSVFEVINEKDLHRSYDIRTANGLITGVTLNKYFRISEFQFLSVFISTGYATTGFSKTNSRLGNGYYEGTFGIAYKGFYRRYFLQRADGSKKYH
ncbi:hypothetical protein [Chitinophaga sp. GbtcB8]|uniref:hypothetical protein n=1 Tax=Chitinophaga sp. GbtcB8 TaxID=2824753 RepID=UPI001C2FB3E8|nr:hypothetical protein [Chitinophaga sp. GbtcB8]